MRREIRNLQAGEYRADNDNCLLQIYTFDEGTRIIQVDLELDIYYYWLITPDGKVTEFDIGSAFEVEL